MSFVWRAFLQKSDFFPYRKVLLICVFLIRKEPIPYKQTVDLLEYDHFNLDLEEIENYNRNALDIFIQY